MPRVAPKLPPDADRWADFHRLPPEERRIVLLLDRADEPAPSVAAALLDRLAAAGYAVEPGAREAAAVRARLAAGETEPFSRADYAGYFAALPRETQEAVNRRWGQPEADPAFRPGRLDCGALMIPVARFGRVAIAVRRAIEPGPPPHGEIALDAWTEDGFRAHGIARIGADGTVAWRLGEVIGRRL
ncbi:MAG: cobaltochelatase subunit CobN [Rhodospirillales bacterium]|nr:cobaltochelatase subunit CobN [Rhodospirillales bacterium]